MVRQPRRHTQFGFTLFELLLTVSIIAIVAALVIPTLSDNERLRLTAASTVMIADIQLAEVMNISYPDEPVVVSFDPANGRYWLAYADDPNTPIPRADTGEPYLVVLGQGRAVGAEGVTFSLTNITGDVLGFNAQGGIDDFSVTPAITLSHAGQSVTLSIAPTTGTITEIAGAPVP